MKENKIKKKIKDFYYKYTGMIKQKKIKDHNFTIISNNCFGGIIYRNYHIPYQSPTCGVYFMAPEYIKFIYNIEDYIYNEIDEVKIENSKYKDYLIENKYDGIIGKIKDIEICFLHFKDINEVNEKWKRRAQRINWKRIIYKFNDQNLCTYKELMEFEKFNAKNKICFTAKKYKNINSIQLEQYCNQKYVLSDTKERDYKKYINIVDYINKLV